MLVIRDRMEKLPDSGHSGNFSLNGRAGGLLLAPDLIPEDRTQLGSNFGMKICPDQQISDGAVSPVNFGAFFYVRLFLSDLVLYQIHL